MPKILIEIEVTRSIQNELINEFSTTRQTVYNALKGITDSYLTRQIRELAVKKMEKATEDLSNN
ncbi:MAG: hypothetical protein R3279_08330 [Putridiphycobacter sp.]|nr:hypothetical protein [Putridiphycobacter sp.]